jgi:hypothetical protein
MMKADQGDFNKGVVGSGMVFGVGERERKKQEMDGAEEDQVGVGKEGGRESCEGVGKNHNNTPPGKYWVLVLMRSIL